MQILYEKILHTIIFIGTPENYFYVFVLPLLVLLLLLRQVRGNFTIDLSGSRKEE